MSCIIVTPEAELEEVLALHGPEALACFGSPSRPPTAPAGIERTLLFTFHDIAEPREGHVAPSHADMERFVSFVREWPRSAPLVLQCWLGVSRSTAAGLISLATLGVSAEKAARRLRETAPFATPNPLMLSHADDALELSGALVAAGRSIGRGTTTDRGRPFMLDVA